MTMTTITPPVLVTGAERQARPYGLFSVVNVQEAGGAPRFESGVQWEHLACSSDVGSISGAICGAGSVDGLPKDFPGTAGQGSASPFFVYGHHKCSPVGWTPSQAEDRARQHLAVHEESAVEYLVWSGDKGVSPSFVGNGTDVTAATAAKPAAALSALEQYAADEYGSLPVLHVPIGVANALFEASLLTVRGARCYTMTGVPVVIGSGYPGTAPTTGADPAAGTAWGYMTPAMFGYRSAVFTSSNQSGDLLDRGSNDLYAVAERTYSIGYDDCGVGAALFDLA